MKRIWLWIVCYVLGIVMFAFFYFVLFRCNTSSFIIDEEFNEITDGITYYPSVEKLPVQVNYSGLRNLVDFNRDMKPVCDTLAVLDKEMVQLKSLTSDIDTTLAKTAKRMDESWVRNSAIFIEDGLRPIQDSIDFQTRFIEQMLEANGQEYETVLAINGEFVKLAKYEQRKAEQKYELIVCTIDDRISLIDSVLLEEFLQLRDSMTLLDERLSSIQHKYFELRRTVSMQNEQFHEERYKRVGFLDFLYFSFQIGTSNTIGEIVPNNAHARSIASVEMLASIIFWGLFLYRLTNGLRKKNED